MCYLKFNICIQYEHHKVSKTTSETTTKPKRASRFGAAVSQPPSTNANDAIAAIKAQVEARAAQIAQSLHTNSIATHTAAQNASSGAKEIVSDLQAQVAAQVYIYISIRIICLYIYIYIIFFCYLYI